MNFIWVWLSAAALVYGDQNEAGSNSTVESVEYYDVQEPANSSETIELSSVSNTSSVQSRKLPSSGLNRPATPTVNTVVGVSDVVTEMHAEVRLTISRDKAKPVSVNTSRPSPTVQKDTTELTSLSSEVVGSSEIPTTTSEIATDVVKNQTTSANPDSPDGGTADTTRSKKARMQEIDGAASTVFSTATSLRAKPSPSFSWDEGYIEDEENGLENNSMHAGPSATDQKVDTVLSNSTEQLQHHIVLVLYKECDKVNRSDISATETEVLATLGFATETEAAVNLVSCAEFLSLRLSVKDWERTDVDEIVHFMKENITARGYRLVKAITDGRDFDVMDLGVTMHGSTDEDLEILKERELIAYIIAALSACLLLLTFFVFCCVRCAGHRQTSSLDLSDIPHVNLNLENYKITPIPRPSITYQDYGRDMLDPMYSRCRSRSEENVLGQHHFTSDAPSPYYTGSLHREVMSGTQELKTFNGKRQCSRVQSLDIRPINRPASDGWMSNSREKLNTDFERRNLSGIENSGFRRWF